MKLARGCYSRRDVRRTGPEEPDYRTQIEVEAVRRKVQDLHRKGRGFRRNRTGAAGCRKAVDHTHRESRMLVVVLGHMRAVGRTRTVEKEVVVGCTGPEAGTGLVRLEGNLELGRPRLHSSRQTPP